MKLQDELKKFEEFLRRNPNMPIDLSGCHKDRSDPTVRKEIILLTDAQKLALLLHHYGTQKMCNKLATALQIQRLLN